MPGDLGGRRPLRIAATGFVAAEAGSVASANALLLEQLLLFGHQVTFFLHFPKKLPSARPC
jgi:hypothetical protein